MLCRRTRSNRSQTPPPPRAWRWMSPTIYTLPGRFQLVGLLTAHSGDAHHECSTCRRTGHNVAFCEDCNLEVSRFYSDGTPPIFAASERVKLRSVRLKRLIKTLINYWHVTDDTSSLRLLDFCRIVLKLPSKDNVYRFIFVEFRHECICRSDYRFNGKTRPTVDDVDMDYFTDVKAWRRFYWTKCWQSIW